VAVIAVYAALFLSLSNAGAAAARSAPLDENALRAKRGLLPRKVRAPPQARARTVVLPPATTGPGGRGRAIAATAAETPLRPPEPRPFVVASGVEVEVRVVMRWPGERR
jgi:hypothetical protein